MKRNERVYVPAPYTAGMPVPRIRHPDALSGDDRDMRVLARRFKKWMYQYTSGPFYLALQEEFNER